MKSERDIFKEIYTMQAPFPFQHGHVTNQNSIFCNKPIPLNQFYVYWINYNNNYKIAGQIYSQIFAYTLYFSKLFLEKNK